jgi:hypothetical protein
MIQTFLFSDTAKTICDGGFQQIIQLEEQHHTNQSAHITTYKNDTPLHHKITPKKTKF